MNIVSLSPAIHDLSGMLRDFIVYLDVSPATSRAYAKALKIFFGFLKEQNIQRPAREDVLAWRDSLKEHIKPATIKLYLAGIRRFFGWLAMRDLYPDIARSVKSPKIISGFRKDALTASQARELLESIDRHTPTGLRDYALIALMLTTGLRDIEVSRADVSDIRPVGNDMVLFIRGKGRDEKDAYVKLAPEVEKSIRLWLASARADGPIFFSTSNRALRQRLSTRSISGIVKKALKNIGLNSSRLTAHSLRHTAATLNLLGGGTLEETQQLLRHASITTTMIYSHHLQRAANMSENRIAEALWR